MFNYYYHASFEHFIKQMKFLSIKQLIYLAKRFINEKLLYTELRKYSIINDEFWKRKKVKRDVDYAMDMVTMLEGLGHTVVNKVDIINDSKREQANKIKELLNGGD
jgi:hypothetical protein